MCHVFSQVTYVTMSLGKRHETSHVMYDTEVEVKTPHPRGPAPPRRVGEAGAISNPAPPRPADFLR